MACAARPDCPRALRHNAGVAGEGEESRRSRTRSCRPGSEQTAERTEGFARSGLLGIVMYQSILYSTDGPIATIKLNRPDKLNAFGGSMREEILDAIGRIAADDQVRVLIVTGEGRGFSAGGDIDHLKKLREAKDEAGFRSVLAAGQNITRAF